MFTMETLIKILMFCVFAYKYACTIRVQKLPVKHAESQLGFHDNSYSS